ncbi:MAG: hypothetical protein IPK57_05375 [Chitinophagaceae bacterium]|nr:hypothetical protein [Chitinophagaceae bacterium]
MKRNLLIHNKILPVMMSMGLILFFGSCKKENTEDRNPPEINAVTDLMNRDIALTSVNYGDWIIIKGKHLPLPTK